MGKNGRIAVFLTILLGCSVSCTAQKTRYFKAEHGVGATYLQLGADGQYRVVDREHMGIFLTDEGRWHQTGAVIMFTPADGKKPAYQATANRYHGKIFLSITTPNAGAGIVIPAEQTKKDLNSDLKHLPDHVLFETSARIYSTETKQTYPFRHIGKEH